ncbi:MAG TPA: FKBP-type peptidyl-prolyl cis-trans isomerase N-terminal domain-containing protein [Geobacteraceae bacterium]
MRHAARMLTAVGLLLWIAGPVPFRDGVARASEEKASPTTAAPVVDIGFSYQLDPRLTRSLYMGERWVSLSDFVGAAGQDTIVARAEGLDAKGNRVDINPEWTPADAEMFAVSPRKGKEVRITVRRVGQSTLKVASPTVSRELVVRASKNDNVLQVTISRGQVAAGMRPESGASPEIRKDVEIRKDSGKQRETVSYSLGYKTGANLKARSVDVDPDVYAKAFRQGFSGDNSAVSDREMADALRALQRELKAKEPARTKESARKRRRSMVKKGAAG